MSKHMGLSFERVRPAVGKNLRKDREGPKPHRGPGLRSEMCICMEDCVASYFLRISWENANFKSLQNKQDYFPLKRVWNLEIILVQ